MATKPESLAATAAKKAEVATPGITMPDVFKGPTTPIQARAWSPLITFAHPKRKDEWSKLVGKFGSVDEGEMYFIYKDRMEKLDKPKLGYICGKQFWVSKSPAGELLASSKEEMPHPWKEIVEAVVLLYLEDVAIPANIQFRTTKCPAARDLSNALIEAATPAWLEKSAAHKETAVLNQPFLRFYGITELADPRPSKSSGLPYRPLNAVIKPTGLVEFRLIKAFQENPDSQALLNMVAQRYESQVKEIESKAV